jgi:hypothetical protein
MKERKALLRETLQRYRPSDRGTKTKILDEFVAATQLNRKYALQLLKGTLRRPLRQRGTRRRRRPSATGPVLLWCSNVCGRCSASCAASAWHVPSESTWRCWRSSRNWKG